jgi:hypothetical protein
VADRGQHGARITATFGSAGPREAGRPNRSACVGFGFAVPLKVLTSRQREVVFLRYFADLSYDEIGRILGIADGTVAATLNGAHGALRHAMQEAPG